MRNPWKLILQLCVCFTTACTTSTTNLDLTELPYSTTEIQIIDQQMPEELRSRYIKRLESYSVLSQYINLSYYSTASESSDTLVIYFSSGSGLGELQLLSCSGANCALLDRTTAVRAGVPVRIQFDDIDCDGDTEVVASCNWGATQMFSMSVFSIENHRLIPLTPSDRDSLLTGLYIELVDRDSNCVKELELQTPSRVGYAPDSLRTYLLNENLRQFIHSKTEDYKGSKAAGKK